MYVFHRPSFVIKNGKKFWIRKKKLYGEDYRVEHWNIPLVHYWNKVPIAVKWQWHCNTCFNNRHKGKRKELKHETYRYYRPYHTWDRDL